VSRILEQLVSNENLSWAWQKTRRLYETSDGPVDWAEVAAFELDLERQLRLLAKSFQNLSYRLRPLVLLPQPKKPDEDGNPRLRQSFHVAVRDQVAWIALANVVGPILDSQMPPWSYGHRLYKAAWFEETDDGQHLELGPYRHSTGSLYRKFKHSWPLFRRHISLTARLMVGALEDEAQLDAAEQSALKYGDQPHYLQSNYWKSTENSIIYYASIDLEKFYPSITKNAIVRGFHRYLADYKNDQWLQNLIGRMLNFRVGAEGSRLLDDPIVQPMTGSGKFGGIPTGLMVAGFLSNVAMLRLDRLIELRLGRDHRIAHFRFVDDHAMLAYDFDELRAWVRKYERALARLCIGPIISQTKFDPPEMAKAYRRGADPADVARAAAVSMTDGSRPSNLMTKTLALVSELAGADFDILSADSRDQRLRELEWLLLADLPDREIRSDTRAAFAAGRIASLVPVAFSPSVALLHSARNLARLNLIVTESSSETLKQELIDARNQVNLFRIVDRNRYRKRLDHYFKLMLQAFHDHPDKPRLFIRVLDYCRITGHPGTKDILNWIIEHENDSSGPLACYLRPLAVQTIARHVATAGFDVTNSSLLERQRLAAYRYLSGLCSQPTRPLLKTVLQASGQSDVATIAARACFWAATASAADSLRRRTRKLTLGGRLDQLAKEIGAPPLRAPTTVWVKGTGHPIGVWTHWLEWIARYQGNQPSRTWMVTAAHHDPRLRLDWESLRKGPRFLPANQVEFLAREGMSNLSKLDAGWLLDQLSSEHPVDLSAFAPGPPVVVRLRRHLKEVAAQEYYMSALEWVAALKVATSPDGHDPRTGEWTALEILRQILAQIRTFGGPDVDVLNELHPSNVLLPRDWLSQYPPGNSLHTRWTWESWKFIARRLEKPVRLARLPLPDYRRHATESVRTEDAALMWRTQLRACGLLLLGLVAGDFQLPASWNIRGLERNTAGFVRSALEEVPMSSHTLAIIEAALLPRSVETALMRNSPWAFFGFDTVETINDTTTDPPQIDDVEALWAAVTTAQNTLETRQISVLDHTPRQLIPMNVIQLIGAAVEILEQDNDL
jgi:hypothetical protein